MMLSRKTLGASLLLAFLLLGGAGVSSAQDKTTGSIRGKVRVDSSSTPEGVMVVVRDGEREVRRAETDRKGEFLIQGLPAGYYGLTFRKPGLSVGSLERVEVRAGKVRTLNDRLFMPIDVGSLAIIRGSVFNAGGRIVRGAQVEIALIRDDGSTKRLDGRVTTESGMFNFRLTPERARYLITVKADGMETKKQEVEVDGASRNNIAITLSPAAK